MLQNIPKEKVLEVVKQGPTIPTRIVKVLGGDSMLIGALLSTLINNGQVKVSTLKIGGSPLYYVPGDEQKLEGFIEYLAEKDRKTFELLKKTEILQDSIQEPLIRFSLKIIRDFAKPFEIDVEGKKELFWRYYLVDEQLAKEKAIQALHSKPVAEQEIRPATSHTALHELAPSVMLQAPITTASDAQVSTSPAPTITSLATQTIETASSSKTSHAQTTKPSTSEFFDMIKERLHELHLDLITKDKIKKSEYALVVKDHDTNAYYYCVAKDKKTINEGDLSTAFVYAQTKKMPCIFFMTGKLTKKAESMIHKEFKEIRIEELS